MTLNLTDKELKTLVENHVNQLIGVPQDRLKVTFTRRQTQTDTSIEILAEGKNKSIIDFDDEDESQTSGSEEVAQDEPKLPDNMSAILK